MRHFKQMFSKKYLSFAGLQFSRGVKRKYPINPDHVNELPVFQYATSKQNYRRVFAWGNAQTGALGFKGLIDKDVMVLKCPKRLSFGEKFEVTNAAAGFGFSLFAVNSDTNVKLYGTGLNTDSQIGYHEIRKGFPLEVVFYPQPISLPIKDPTKTKIKKIAAGRAHSVVLTDEGVFTMGNNSYGQCGRKIIENEDYIRSNTIHHIQNINNKEIIDIECGQDHSLFITADGSVYSCGWGADGQTGLGHFKNSDCLSKINGDIENEKIVKISCRSDFVMALSEKGDVFGWGNTEYGQMSLPDDEQQLCHPTHIKMLQGHGKFKSVASAGSFCLAANENGEVFTWGYGLLGKNDFQPESKVVQVFCGLYHAAAVTNYGDLYIWGRNKSGCLGLGDEKDQSFPLKVCLAGHVKKVYCGIDHTIALCKPFI
ncbi:hypothetical protein GWI33_006605 [Rhynchophorus ferrugineus]|uniref:Uncharacterized protein n=1 Tax=Rhynchophorus ferrugineus TaxID=354439 RepID=A0A834MH70_RHYFE|nr:hypothetical protein GWI33_006605 [Rhynchophorus ferrugineus]